MTHLPATPRAARYEIAAPVRYRCSADGAWQEGSTIDVSRTGVLFQTASGGLCRGDRLEFILLLPSPGPRVQYRVQCHGAVVRQSHDAARGRWVTAASIDAYELLGVATHESVVGGRSDG